MNLNEGRAIVERLEFDGLKISIEVKAGGTRWGVNKQGKKWYNKVFASYGYILSTNSPDGEHLDVWVKKNPREGKQVYVMHQLTPDGSKYDEDKVMIGYSSADEAIDAFKRHLFKPNQMYGGYSEFSMEHFKVIAFAARNSTVMIASQKMYDKFTTKGLLPKGIKSPIQLSQIVKEGMDMDLHISYKNQIIAESAFDLALNSGISAKKANLDVIFESSEDLSKFIRLVDESQEDNAHLGDLYEMLPENFSQLTESNLTDAIDDLKSELRVGDDHFSIADEVAKDYGLDGDQLIGAFEKAVGMSIRSWAEHREGIRNAEQNQKQLADKAAADAKAEKEAASAEKNAAAAQKRKMNSPQYKMNWLATYVMQRIGDFFPDGDPTDAVMDGLHELGIDSYDYQRKYESHFTKQFKAATGYETPYQYAAAMWDDLEADNPNTFGDRNPYRESVDDMLKLAGVRSSLAERQHTPSVHTSKSALASLNESHNAALRKFMVNGAIKKQRAVMESVTDTDMDAVLRRFGNTVLANPNVPAAIIAEKVAERLLDGNSRALHEHVGAVTGLSVDSFAQAIAQRKWSENRISRQAFESIMESTNVNWNLNCPDKGTAFTKACR